MAFTQQNGGALTPQREEKRTETTVQILTPELPNGRRHNNKYVSVSTGVVPYSIHIQLFSQNQSLLSLIWNQIIIKERNKNKNKENKTNNNDDSDNDGDDNDDNGSDHDNNDDDDDDNNYINDNNNNNNDKYISNGWIRMTTTMTQIKTIAATATTTTIIIIIVNNKINTAI